MSVRERRAGGRPRLAFLGLGWIGLHRLTAVVESGLAEVVLLADPELAALQRALELAPGARVVAGLDGVLEEAAGLDAVIIATPSALHASQALPCLAAGLAVHCQKPLGRQAAEVAHVLAAAARNDRRLGVDFCYRHVRAAQRLRQLVQDGDIGRVYDVELVFHNAYGPDKAWFYDRERSGGGCVIDLGSHLVDLLLHVLGFPAVEGVTSRLFEGGRRLPPGADAVEDHGFALLDLEGGARASLTCSWNRPAGRDAVIEATFTGTAGALALTNVGGSFYDFRLERRRGTSAEVLCEPPDAWGGRGLCAWIADLAADPRYDREIEQAAVVARVLDRIYGRVPGQHALPDVAPREGGAATARQPGARAHVAAEGPP